MVRGDTTDPALGREVTVAPPACGLEAVAGSAEAAVADADRRLEAQRSKLQEQAMNSLTNATWYAFVSFLVLSCAAFPSRASPAQQKIAEQQTSATGTIVAARSFESPQEAAAVLIEAASRFDVTALAEIFGPEIEDVIFSGEFAQDRKHAADFVAEAREKNGISVDPKSGTRAFLLVGNEDWPFPVPIVKRGSTWTFDTEAGHQELVHRRIGANELDAIEICHGYVEAQHEYALQPHEGYEAHQYAQRIISAPGKQDGLAWQKSDGSWGGPVGEKIARAIEQGYSSRSEPYHGYFFKILKGQGPAAALGQMDFVVNGLMIGGFALVAAPAEYGVTGVKTFIVSHDGVVYEKDFGFNTLDQFQTMELFNPDKSWSPVPE